MSLFLIVLFFGFFGTCIGSFCGVITQEPQKNRSFWTGRSECLSCHKFLTWFELIPILSYCMQKGKCRKCQIHIPFSVLYIEILMGIIWMILGTSLFLANRSIGEISIFMFLITGITLLAFIDLRTYIIPDRLSIPMLVMTLCIIFLNHYSDLSELLPPVKLSLIWWFVGLFFYLLQMLIPIFVHLVTHKIRKKYIDVLLMPLIALMWIFFRMFFGEKFADKCFPTFSLLDEYPTWAWGGDLRLGLLVWLLLWPWNFFLAVAIGYTIGSCIYVFYHIFFKKKLEVLPVAPLLWLGFLCIWIINIL